jgi:cytoskeletal protein CcmA (bactofilin family)
MGIFGKPPDQTKPATKPVEPTPAPRPAPAPVVSPSSPATATSVSRAAGLCVIGPKTTVKGDITGDEDILVEGTVEGQIRITRDLRIGPGGSVRAKVEAQSVMVSGELLGDCHATSRVEIQSTGRLTGNIRAPRVVIAEGATFKGNSDMSFRADERRDKTAAS